MIIGDVFIPSYNNKKERDKSLTLFHTYRLKNSKTKEAKLIERIAFKDGLRRKGEYKISIEKSTELLKKSRYKILEIIKIGSQKFGGYNIIIAQKK